MEGERVMVVVKKGRGKEWGVLSGTVSKGRVVDNIKVSLKWRKVGGELHLSKNHIIIFFSCVLSSPPLPFTPSLLS